MTRAATLRRLVGLLIAGALTLLVLPWPHALAVDDSRVEAMRTALDDSGVYLEPSTALGDPATWRQRLEEARQEADLGLPIHVALWDQIPGVAPEGDVQDWEPERRRELLGIDEGIVVVHASGRPRVLGDLPDGPVGTRVRALADQADGVADALVAAAPQQFRQLTPVAWTWVFLRLAAPEGPSAPALLAELEGDTSLLQDSSSSVERPGRTDDFSYSDPAVLIPGGIVILLTIGVFVLLSLAPSALTGGRIRPVEQPLRRDPMPAGLTSLSLEQEVTALAEAIAASDVRPGESSYERAQACADAAGHYVDSPLDRDRVGVHLLVRDGHRDLSGEPREARCFFHPGHAADTTVRRSGVVEVPTCAACARAVTSGARPESLVVADADGHLGAYYDTRDVWTATGYGALDDRWARRALLAALERR